MTEHKFKIKNGLITPSVESMGNIDSKSLSLNKRIVANIDGKWIGDVEPSTIISNDDTIPEDIKTGFWWNNLTLSIYDNSKQMWLPIAKADPEFDPGFYIDFGTIENPSELDEDEEENFYDFGLIVDEPYDEIIDFGTITITSLPITPSLFKIPTFEHIDDLNDEHIPGQLVYIKSNNKILFSNGNEWTGLSVIEPFKYISPEPLLSHIIKHNLNSEFISCEVLVRHGDVYKNDTLSITHLDLNTVVVDANEPINIKAIIKKN